MLSIACHCRWPNHFLLKKFLSTFLAFEFSWLLVVYKGSLWAGHKSPMLELLSMRRREALPANDTPNSKLKNISTLKRKRPPSGHPQKLAAALTGLWYSLILNGLTRCQYWRLQKINHEKTYRYIRNCNIGPFTICRIVFQTSCNHLIFGERTCVEENLVCLCIAAMVVLRCLHSQLCAWTRLIDPWIHEIFHQPSSTNGGESAAFRHG